MGDMWKVRRGDRIYGPFLPEQLRNLANSGKLKPIDLVRRGEGEWQEASSVVGLFSREKETDKILTTETEQKRNVFVKVAVGVFGFALFLTLFLALLPDQKQKATNCSEDISVVAQPSDDTSKALPVDIGTLEDMGDKVYENLPFANVDQSPNIESVPLSEDFAQAGTFSFRRILPDSTKATMSPQKWEQFKTLGYTERTIIQELKKSFDIRMSEGEPKCLLESEDWPGLTHVYPIIRIGANLGDRWEWTNHDVSGNEMVYHYNYCRSVQHNGVPCVRIDSELFIDGEKCERVERWYAKGLGLVKESEFTLLPFKMEATMHRIIVTPD